MVVYLIIIIIYYYYYYLYGSQYKTLMAIFSGSTERNSIKLGQCGEGMSTK